MKKLTFILTVLIVIAFSSCSVFKKNTNGSQHAQDLSGTWVLTYITGPRIAFEGLYPNAKPVMTFNLEKNEFNGNTSCNSFGGMFKLDKDKIEIEKPHSTLMACPGNGESVFINTLLKVEKYKVKGDTLSFYMDDIEMMRFAKKQ